VALDAVILNAVKDLDPDWRKFWLRFFACGSEWQAVYVRPHARLIPPARPPIYSGAARAATLADRPRPRHAADARIRRLPYRLLPQPRGVARCRRRRYVRTRKSAGRTGAGGGKW